MGIEFLGLSQNFRQQMKGRIASPSAGNLRIPETKPKRTLNLPPITQPGAALDAISQPFEAKATLSAEEFVRIVTDSQPRSR